MERVVLNIPRGGLSSLLRPTVLMNVDSYTKVLLLQGIDLTLRILFYHQLLDQSSFNKELVVSRLCLPHERYKYKSYYSIIYM